MPSFPKPDFSYAYQVDAQIVALRDYERTKPGRDIPDRTDDRLLVATWNIANFGDHERREKDHRLIAEMISWFDIVAVQEVKDNRSSLLAVLGHLPATYRVLHSDVAGNRERLAFYYDSEQVTFLEKVGEVAIPPASQRYIQLPGVTQKFSGFDRNPYVGSFQSGPFTFIIASVHLYFGSDSSRDRNRRALEAYAVGRWADLRRKSPHAFSTNIIVLGDFNIPKVQPGDDIYEALVKRGLVLPEHSNAIGSNLSSDKDYDQIAFFPGALQDAFVRSGVFDFDGALFSHLWETRSEADFKAYLRYYISDHRILWAQFRR